MAVPVTGHDAREQRRRASASLIEHLFATVPAMVRASETSRATLRWQTVEDEPVLPGLADRVTYPEFRDVEFLHVRAKSIINHVPAASGMPFEWTINTYRGCTHACTYCFARPTHTYLDLDAGRDFERRIVVKINAVERLRSELRSPRWRGDAIALGTNTDPYQRCEGRYRLTRGVLETLTLAGNPFTVLTKGTLVLRDLDVFEQAQARVGTAVNLSIATLDDDVWRATEPGTAPPQRRIDTVADLNRAGIPSGILIAPIIPGLSDDEAGLAAVVRAAVEAGARFVSPIVLHLRPGVRELFLPWLEDLHPDLVERYERLYRRSYAPKAERARITAVVRRLVDRYAPPDHPMRAPTRGSGRVVQRHARRQEARTAPPGGGSEQLELGV